MAKTRLCADTRGVVAVDDEGRVLAASLMDTWSFNSCHMHLFIENPFVIRHGFLQELFGFVFGDESGREVAIGIIAEDNKKSLKMAKHLGFKEVSRIPDGYKKGVDYVLTHLRKEDCKWIGDKHER